MDLSNLKTTPGSRSNKKRIGRGEGSGTGVTAGRGNKGYGSRSGAKKRKWFEGGQMPLQRRLPKFGFTNIHKKMYQIVNVSALEKLAKEKEINSDVLYKNKLVRNKNLPVKILGHCELKAKINVKVDAISKSAQQKIEKSGGSVTLS